MERDPRMTRFKAERGLDHMTDFLGSNNKGAAYRPLTTSYILHPQDTTEKKGRFEYMNWN